MDADEFTRLNLLSEILLFKTATPNELIEFYDLFDEWKISDDFNLFDEFYILAN